MQKFDSMKANLQVGISKKSCIFKEGDDLRQDILALQIIEFFLKVLQVVVLPPPSNVKALFEFEIILYSDFLFYCSSVLVISLAEMRGRGDQNFPVRST
jgi:hypothetical protein